MQEIPPSGIWGFVWRYIKEKKFFLVAIIFVGLSWAAIMAIRPWVMKQIVDAGISEHDVLIYLCAGYVGLAIWNSVVTNFYTYINAKTYPKLIAKITVDMYVHLLGHSFSYFKDNLSGSLTDKISSLTSNFEQLIIYPLEKFFTGTVRIIFACIVLLLSVHIYFSIALLTWSVFFIFITFYIAKKTKKYSNDLSESKSTITGRISETIANVASIKIFSSTDKEIDNLKKAVNEHTKLSEDLEKSTIRINIFQGGAVIILMSVMLALLVFLKKNSLVTAGDFVLVIMLTSSLVDAIYMLGRQIVEFSRYVGSCDQALSFVKEPYGLKDIDGAKDIVVTRGKILIKDLNFSYDGQVKIIKSINMRISSGEKIGIVGKTGSGKTTLIKLLLRLYEIDSGVIKVDNKDISQVTRSSLRDSIALIPQDPTFFHRSIAENILVAKPDATKEELISACKKACCHDFIMELYDGYDSIVGERGVKLSGGQKQRLAIARAIIKDSPILILDEATSSLDSITEEQICRGINEAMKNRTTIVIAHRLQTLSNMDLIMVLEDGEIIEKGEPEKLLKQNSYFAKIWKKQIDGFIYD